MSEEIDDDHNMFQDEMLDQSDELISEEVQQNGSLSCSSSSRERIQRQRDINRFPITRIRIIMKMDPELTIASQESVFLISRAAELFVQYQAQQAYKRTKQSKRKTVQKKDIDAAINDLDCMAFLEGAID